MPAAPRVRPLSIFSPAEWATVQSQSSWIGPLLVAHCWGVIGAAMAVGALWPWLIPLCVAVIGARQLGLAILMHEAAHGGLSSQPRVNDVLGHWLCAVPIGASLDAYRPYHLRHHKYAQQAEDPDLPLSAPFPVTGASLRRKMLRDLTGQTFFKQRVLFALKAFRSSRDEEIAEGAVVTGRALAPFLLVNAGLLVGLTVAGFWWVYFALWLLPMATWLPLATRLRNIAEHACVESSREDPFRAARTTRASWWERALIAPYWVNYHAEHHLFMYCRFYNLPRLHRLLATKGYADRMEIAPGYLSVLRQATNQKADVPIVR
jgi:fatty acid desaturase